MELLIEDRVDHATLIDAPMTNCFMAVARRSARLPLRSVLLFPLLAALAAAALLAGYASYARYSRRLYFPFETRSPLRPPRTLAQFPHLRRNTTETATVFRHLVSVLITRYMRFHRSNRFDPSARKLIWTGKGNHFGFGDRFRGILHAYLSAVVSDRVLLIAWDEPFPLSTVFASTFGVSIFYDARLDPGRFPVAPKTDVLGAAKNPPPYAGGGVHSNGTADLPWCDCSLKKLGILLSPHKTVVVRAEAPPSLRFLFLAMREHAHLPTALALKPVMDRWREASGADGDEAIYALIFRALFRPAPPLLALLASQSSDLRRLVPARSRPPNGGTRREGGYVAVHARVGVGFGEAAAYPWRFDLAARGASVELVARCLAVVAASEADDADLPEPQVFYVASDTPALSAGFRAEVRRQSRDAVVLELAGEKVHSNRMDGRSGKDKEKFILTAADLLFLSAGTRLVSLRSGFANLAKWFGEAPHRGVSIDHCVQRMGALVEAKV